MKIKISLKTLPISFTHISAVKKVDWYKHVQNRFLIETTDNVDVLKIVTTFLKKIYIDFLI